MEIAFIAWRYLGPHWSTTPNWVTTPGNNLFSWWSMVSRRNIVFLLLGKILYFLYVYIYVQIYVYVCILGLFKRPVLNGTCSKAYSVNFPSSILSFLLPSDPIVPVPLFPIPPLYDLCFIHSPLRSPHQFPLHFYWSPWVLKFKYSDPKFQS